MRHKFTVLRDFTIGKGPYCAIVSADLEGRFHQHRSGLLPLAGRSSSGSQPVTPVVEQ